MLSEPDTEAVTVWPLSLSDAEVKVSVGAVPVAERPESDSVGAVIVTVPSVIEAVPTVSDSEAVTVAPMVVSVSVSLIELIVSDSVAVPPEISVSRRGVQALLPAASMAQMR